MIEDLFDKNKPVPGEGNGTNSRIYEDPYPFNPQRKPFIIPYCPDGSPFPIPIIIPDEINRIKYPFDIIYGKNPGQGDYR